MPKLKTNKAARKRFRVTKRGKILRSKAGRRHLLSVRTTKRKRHLRKAGQVAKPDEFKVRKLLGLA